MIRSESRYPLFRTTRKSDPEAFYRKPGRFVRPPMAAKALRIRSFLKTIADAIKRFDHLEIVVNDLEFLAQTLDVAVDGAIIDIDLIVVGGVHQRVAALDHAGTSCERLQDQELGDGEGDRFTLPCTGVPLGIHAQLAPL